VGTFDSRELVVALIAGNGRPPNDQEDAPDNPRAVRITEYENAAERTCWGVVFENEPRHTWGRYEVETAAVRNPRVIWVREL